MATDDKKIMIFDDDATTRLAVKLVLSAAGYTVLAEDDTPALAERVRQERPVLVILDASLPITTTGTIDDFSSAAHTPVVLLYSSYEPDELERLCASFGASGYLVKDGDLEGLARAVENQLAP